MMAFKIQLRKPSCFCSVHFLPVLFGQSLAKSSNRMSFSTLILAAWILKMCDLPCVYECGREEGREGRGGGKRGREGEKGEGRGGREGREKEGKKRGRKGGREIGGKEGGRRREGEGGREREGEGGREKKGGRRREERRREEMMEGKRMGKQLEVNNEYYNHSADVTV